MPSMTGIYGEPLELVKTWLQGLEAFGSFSPGGDVYLYERTGDEGAEPEEGDAWAVLSYKQNGHVIDLVPGLDVTRVVELCLVRCVRRFSEETKAALVNDVGDIVRGLMDATEPAGILTRITLFGFQLDDTAEPVRLGAILHLSLDIGGR